MIDLMVGFVLVFTGAFLSYIFTKWLPNQGELQIELEDFRIILQKYPSDLEGWVETLAKPELALSIEDAQFAFIIIEMSFRNHKNREVELRNVQLLIESAKGEIFPISLGNYELADSISNIDHTFLWFFVERINSINQEYVIDLSNKGKTVRKRLACLVSKSDLQKIGANCRYTFQAQYFENKILTYKMKNAELKITHGQKKELKPSL